MNELRSANASSSPQLGKRGQVFVLFLVFLLPMTVIAFSVYDVGVAVSEKMKLQNAADNAAYSAATYEARYMNQVAYINRVVVANYDAMATLVGIWSEVDALDGFLYLAHFVIQKIPLLNVIDSVLGPVHAVVHTLDSTVAQLVGGNKDASDASRQDQFLELLEKYNGILRGASNGLYLLTQASRKDVVQAIARGVDPTVDSWELAEVNFNLQSLDDRRVYESANDTDSDRGWKGGPSNSKDDGLRLTIERSLNEYSNGDSFRDIGSWNLPCLDITVGNHGYNGPGFDHIVGNNATPGEPDPSGSPVSIVRNTEIYQLDFSGLKVKFTCFITDLKLVDIGHYSDDDFNTPYGSFGGTDVPHMFDTDDGADEGHSDNNIEPNLPSNTCDSGTGSLNPGSIAPDPKDMALDQACKDGSLPTRIFGAPPKLQIQTNAPETDPAKMTWENCDAVDARVQAAESAPANNFAKGVLPACPVKYVFDDELDNVDVTTFKQDKSLDAGSRVQGPRLYVKLRKQSKFLPQFFGGDIGSPYDMEADSWGRVYYTQRMTPPTVNQTKESLFNPFWAGALESPQK